MNLSFLNRIKYSPFLYSCYFYIGSFCLSILSKIIKPQNNKIFFISFGGRKYDDSPKAIYEKLLLDDRFNDCEITWAFQDPSIHHIPRGSKIKADTLNYYINLLKSSVWVTNSGVERGLSIPKGNRFYLNTWHGTPIKKMGSDINDSNKAFKSKSRESTVDIMLAQSQHDVDVFSKVFGIHKSKFIKSGLPRNDELMYGNTPENISEIKRKLGISCGKKVILYAPTFREYEKDENRNCILTNPINLELWKTELGTEYIMLFRAHYEVARVMGVKDNSFVKDVSSYQNLNDLMLISDILISDYSSIFFDYSILERPMIAYCYDYDKYASNRGMYFDIREKLNSYINNEIDLLRLLKRQDFSALTEASIRFKKEFIAEAGTASKRALDLISNFIKLKSNG